MKEPLLVHGLMYRDWRLAVARLIAQDSNIGLAIIPRRMERMWLDGLTPQEGYEVWLTMDMKQEVG
jgi:hypothetical protein